MAKRKTLFELIYNDLKKQVLSMSNGDQLKSIEQLCEEHNVSRTVIREVITALERDGLLVRRQGLGTFVVKDNELVHTGIEYLRGLTRIITSSGKKPGLSYDSAKIIKADAQISSKLEMENDEELVVSERIYEADNVPAIFARTYIATNRLSGGSSAFLNFMEKGESKKMTLFDILESNFKDPIRYAVAEIESTIVDDTLARLLKVEKGKSLVVMKEVHRDINNIPLLYSIDYINTSVFRIQVLRKKIWGGFVEWRL